MPTIPRFSVRSAIASHLGMDVAEIEDCRYQPTRTPCAVYVSRDDEFLTATKTSRKPRESDDYHFGTWKWSQIETQGYVKAVGWHIWLADREKA
jgi:hypothetical protein